MNYVEPHPKTGVYRVRREFPGHLHGILKAKSRTCSLGTKNVAEANRRAPAVLADIQRKIDDAEAILRTAGRPDESAEISLSYAKGAELIEAWQHRCLTKSFHFHTTGKGRLGDHLAAAESPAKVDRLWRERPAEMVKLYYSGLPAPTPVADATLDAILNSDGFVLPLRHQLRRPMRGLLHDAATAIRVREERWAKGEWLPDDKAFDSHSDTTTAPNQQQTGGPAPLRRTRETLTGLMEAYFLYRTRGEQTKSEQRLAVARLRDFLGGDLFVDQVDYQHAEDFYAMLLSLPASMTTTERTMSVVALTQKMRSGAIDKPLISRSTVDKQIALLSAMFRWGQSRGYTHIEPFRQLTSPGRHHEKRRQPFSERDLQAIFGAPLFRGSKDAVHWRQPGQHLIDNHDFWIPLLGLATGMRIEEIGQLLVTDIKREHGILYLDIKESVEEEEDIDDGATHTKRLKTASSRRRVPLHRIVLDAGFDEYLEFLRATGKRALFPELPTAGKKTKNLSRTFGRDFLKSVGITNKSKVFHSFRHLFKDRCRTAQLPKEAHDALTGHSNGSAGDSYGNGVPIAVLKQHIDKLSFPGYEPVPPRSFTRGVGLIGHP